MRKIFILILFALNLVYFNQAMALSHIEQNVIFNDEGKPADDGKDKEKNPEDDCD